MKKTPIFALYLSTKSKSKLGLTSLICQKCWKYLLVYYSVFCNFFRFLQFIRYVFGAWLFPFGVGTVVVDSLAPYVP
jgi:hypothetical protein